MYTDDIFSLGFIHHYNHYQESPKYDFVSLADKLSEAGTPEGYFWKRVLHFRKQNGLSDSLWIPNGNKWMVNPSHWFVWRSCLLSRFSSQVSLLQRFSDNQHFDPITQIFPQNIIIFSYETAVGTKYFQCFPSRKFIRMCPFKRKTTMCTEPLLFTMGNYDIITSLSLGLNWLCSFCITRTETA